MPENAGLSDEAAVSSRRMHGSNALTRRARRGFMSQFLASFGDPIIKILLIALFVNVMFMFRDANIYETIGIALAVLLATFVSTLSEYGSESAFDKLQEESEQVRCRVQRNGRLCEISVNDVVVGDLIFLQAGERVPADGMLVRGELTADQSALNGESKEAAKSASGQLLAQAGQDAAFTAKDRLFRGSIVCSGEGTMLVTKVGDSTFYGALAFEIQEDSTPSPLKERLSVLAGTICRIGYACAFVVTFAALFNNIVIDNNYDPVLIQEYLSDYSRVLRDVLRALTLGVTVIVMAVPEGLPMMITVVLSSNMKKMLRDNVLVRKLVGIETSGSLNILFTDKTGTLTEGKLEAAMFLDAAGHKVSFGQLRGQKLFEFVKLNCFFNNGAHLGRVSGGAKFAGSDNLRAIGGNSTDRALLNFIKSDISDIAGCRKTFAMPFDSEKKYSSALIEGLHNKRLVKGAPERILPMCRNAYDAGGNTAALAPEAGIMAQLEGLCSGGMRVIALAEGTPGGGKDATPDNLTLVGFVGIRDELRPEAAEAVASIRGAGIQTVMITGDNARTAASIAVSAGIIDRFDGEDAVITSDALARLSDAEVTQRLPRLRLVSRALPSDKSRLVRLAQEAGLVAGMTGDGVNDAPALKRADVGFAMGDGTEIAKEAADIVILDNNISSIAKAVLYGRTIFKSIRKFIIFQLTVNFCAVGVSVIGPFIGVEAPVTIIQMLWINIIMDTLGAIAFAGEAPLREYMKEPPKKRSERIINRYMYSQIVFTGAYTVALCIAFVKLPFFLGFFRGDYRILMSAFFALFIFAGVFNSFSARTHRLNLFAYIGRNRMFMLIMIAVTVIQLSMVYFGGELFRAAALHAAEMAVVILLAATVIPADTLRKILLRTANRKGFV